MTHATIGAYGRQHKDMVSFVQDQNQARREKTGETPSLRRNQSICGIGRAVPDDHAALRHTSEKLLLSDHKNRKRTIWHCRTGGWRHTQKYLFGTREVWTWMTKDALGSGAEITPHHVRKTTTDKLERLNGTSRSSRWKLSRADTTLKKWRVLSTVKRSSDDFVGGNVKIQTGVNTVGPIRFTPLRGTLKGSCRFRSIVMSTDAVYWTNDDTARAATSPLRAVEKAGQSSTCKVGRTTVSTLLFMLGFRQVPELSSREPELQRIVDGLAQSIGTKQWTSFSSKRYRTRATESSRIEFSTKFVTHESLGWSHNRKAAVRPQNCEKINRILPTWRG